MICKVCNTNNVPGAVYCENCGATLKQEPVAQSYSANDPAPITDPGKTMSIISLILSIAALVLAIICPCSCIYLAWIGYIGAPILAIVAAILGILGMNKSKAAGFNNKMGLVGLILSIASVLVLVVMAIISIVGGISLAALGMVSGAMEGGY